MMNLTSSLKGLAKKHEAGSQIFLAALLPLLLLGGCSGSKGTLLPRDLSNIGSIKPAIAKLPADERELLAGYVIRHVAAQALGNVLGSGGSSVPEGMTIGRAIEEQRKFKTDAALEEAKQRALRAKLQAEHDVALKSMRDAVTVTLLSKGIDMERGYGGIVLDENFKVTFGYKNNTPQDIAGVKGHISVKDLFGDEISGFQISNDDTLKAGQSLTWTGSRSVRFSLGENHDRKLAALSDDKYKVVWEPEVIVFADGTKKTVPDA